MENRASKIPILDSKEEDRISKLPEPILHHILCSLSQKEAIKTCLLSKAWRYLGCTRPKIKFDFCWRRTSDYSALVRILQGYHDRNLRLDKFSLSLSDDNDDDHDNGEAMAALLNKWIPIIIQSMRVKSFDLSFNNSTPHVKLPSLILESHHIQNLILSGGMFESSTTRVDLKHLRRLDLHNVYIPDEILDDLLSSCCPFIENVSISYCEGFTRIKLLSYNPTNLTHFFFSADGDEHHHAVRIEIGNGIQTLKSIKLSNCLLSVSHPKPLLSGSFSCNLTGLDLHDVYIPEQLLGDLLSNCTFIDKLSLVHCNGFARIKMLKNVADFSFHGFEEDGDVSVEIGDMQTLRAMDISCCLFSVSPDKPLEYARLRRLSLRKVKLSSGLFSCNLHSLEHLSLCQCSSIEELKLSSRSMKRLTINNVGTPFKATIDAPSIVSFNYNGILPQSISFATTNSSDDLWQSGINLLDEPSFDELYGLLKALSQSTITLSLDQIEIHRFGTQLHIGDDGSANIDDIVGSVSEEAKHELPVAVEHLRIQSLAGEAPSSAAAFLNMMLHMFRPSFVHLFNTKKLREIVELLFKKETTQCYIWQRVLEGVNLQVKYHRKQREWQPVEHTSFTEGSKKGAQGRKLEFRIHLKWRD